MIHTNMTYAFSINNIYDHPLSMVMRYAIGSIVFAVMLVGTVMSTIPEMIFATTDTAQLRETPSTTDGNATLAAPDTRVQIDVDRLPPLTESVRLAEDGGPLEGMKCYKQNADGTATEVKCPDVVVTTG